MNNEITFASKGFAGRLMSMLKVDFRRMFSGSRFFIMALAALVIPVLVLVMTSSFGGEELVFSNAWQMIGQENGMNMDMTAMMNINLMYFMSGILSCLFVADDFKSGYVKNLFTARPRKGDYVASKTIVNSFCGALFLVLFFAGTLAGGRLAGLPFILGSAGAAGLVLCMVSKMFLMTVFVSIFVMMAVLGRQRAWLSVLLALFGGMLLFMMVPMMTPINSGVMNAGMTLAGGLIFSWGLGQASKAILLKSDLV